MKRRTTGLLQLLIVALFNLSNIIAPGLRATREPWALTLSKLIYQAWSYNCHQLLERSFHAFGYPLPMCSRCTGIWLGSLLYCLYLLASGKIGTDKPIKLSWFILLSAPLVLDGGTQALGWRVSDNLLRLSTGILYGWACTGLALAWANRFSENPRKAWTGLRKDIKAGITTLLRR